MNEKPRLIVNLNKPWLYCAMVAAFLIAKNILQISIPNSQVVLITCAISLFAFINLSQGYEIVYFVFLIPLQAGLSLPAINLFFCVIMLYKQLRRHSGEIRTTCIPIVFLSLLELWNVLLGKNNFVEYACVLTFILFMYVSIAEMEDVSWDNHVIAEMVYSFVAGLVVASVVILVINARSVSWGTVLSGSYRVGKTSEYIGMTDYIISYNVNTLADFCLMGITSIIVLIHYQWINKPFAVAIAAYLVFVGFLTQTRTLLLVLGIVFILASIVLNNKWRRFVIPMCLAGVALYYMYLNNTIPSFTAAINRFFAKDMATFSGRTEITTEFNKLLFSNPIRLITGYGIIDYHGYSMAGSSHNGTQELFLTVGIVGASALLYWTIKNIRNAFRASTQRGKNRLFSLIPLLAFTVFLQSNQFLSLYYHMCFLAMCIMYCSLDYKRE